jgi:hypothetical protein
MITLRTAMLVIEGGFLAAALAFPLAPRALACDAADPLVAGAAFGCCFNLTFWPIALVVS